MQDAVRILMLIDKAGEPISGSALAASDAPLATVVSVVRTQVRLQKLDFWVRNPDYLANELLNDYENCDKDPSLLQMAGEILDSEEPELRRYPMLRYLFGAYEDLDDALAVLRQADLVIRRKVGRPDRVARTDYYLTEAGRDMADHIRRGYPELAWYSTRAALVVLLSDGQGATTLKDRQYLVDEYLNTPHGVRIPSVTERARQRLADIRATLEGQEA